jgi:hypothetical protein
VAARAALSSMGEHFDRDVCISMVTLSIQINAMIRSGKILSEEKTPLIELVDRIYSSSLDPSYFLSVLPDYLSEVRIDNLLRQARAGKITNREAAEEIKSVIEVRSGNSERGVIVNPLEQCLIGDCPVEVVPTMIQAIDAPMNGGLGLGEFGILCGISGLGKTTLAVNFCWGAAKLGYQSALATLELPSKKISERLYSRITGVSYNRIRMGDNGDMDSVKREVWERIQMEDPMTRSRFNIFDFSDQLCTLSMLDARLAQAQKEGKLPKLLFIDWLDAMGTDPSVRRGGYVPKELRHILQSLSQGCSDLAKKYHIAIWATTQSNAEAEGERIVRMRNSAEGFSKNWRCSVFLGMGATDQDRLENRITVTASKMRDGMIFSTQIQARLDIQKFCDIENEEEILDGMANFIPIRNS